MFHSKSPLTPNNTLYTPISRVPPISATHRSFPQSPPAHSYPPTPRPLFENTISRQPKEPKKKRERLKWTKVRSILYHSSFWFCVLLNAALLVAAAWGMGEQAWRTGGQKNWNVLVVVLAYVITAFLCITHSWSRIISIKKMLKTMPKPYIPTKPDDVPPKVANHVATEYSRTAVISHISQATTGQQEGWGRPGTKWEGKHFRSWILGSVSVMREALGVKDDLSYSPLSFQPFYNALTRIPSSSPENPFESPSSSSTIPPQEDTGLRVLLNSWVKYIEQARYAKREPGEREAGAVERLVEIVLLTMKIKEEKGNTPAQNKS
ncbi:hypothetical protein L202_08221 [Cryptococcus amylolentus CBS 6039]|uniref:Defect at low temperature protein 1 n=1 Tax=Cryptococcus amylolentus CBS 6039 TaxID=1295533 RepID=A0A1E3HAJ6_9TREE|nr:hypothetical protein L202_08221 [Cryptococcus amylolentus CBS 6039]ODN72786.1 hypothetical protein L202_08221 [Cryptococcus amylolentus CBS 6039]